MSRSPIWGDVPLLIREGWGAGAWAYGWDGAPGAWWGVLCRTRGSMHLLVGLWPCLVLTDLNFGLEAGRGSQDVGEETTKAGVRGRDGVGVVGILEPGSGMAVCLHPSQNLRTEGEATAGRWQLQGVEAHSTPAPLCPPRAPC